MCVSFIQRNTYDGFVYTIIPKNMKSKHNNTGLSHFEQSPSEQLGAVRVHLHAHHHGAVTGAAVGGTSGGGRWQHFHAFKH